MNQPALKDRKFLFRIPAEITVGCTATTEVEAWLLIKQRLRERLHFSGAINHFSDADSQEHIAISLKRDNIELIAFDTPEKRREN